MKDTEALRREMVDHQVFARGVRDEKVLQAMARVPRERFVPTRWQAHAYEDRAFAVDGRRTMMPAYVTAFMVEALVLRGGEKVLQIGAATGYTTAVIAEIAGTVHVIEPDPQQAEHVSHLLSDLGYRNVHFRVGREIDAWAREAPFEAILAGGALEEIPDAMTKQLAVGGRMAVPIGDAAGIQELTRINRIGETGFQREDLVDLRAVPSVGFLAGLRVGQHRRLTRIQRTPAALPGLILHHAEVFDDVDTADLDGLIDRIGDRRVILLGEASHGTSEFYHMRARITRRLIAEKGFTVVAVEADWPDAAQIDAHVRQKRDYDSTGAAFRRFPTWMWRNKETHAFMDWLRDWNAGKPHEAQTGFYGLDLYSLFESARAIIDYLDDVDPDLAAEARRRYGCLSPWEADPAAYGHAALTGAYRNCEKDVTSLLSDLMRKRADYVGDENGHRFLDAAQNATLVANAERYYRIMYYGSRASWNLRDTHMFETLMNIMAHQGPASRAVVWAHNSHIGDARATEMSKRGERNLGEMCAREYGYESYRIGFGTDRGTVAAASTWGGEMEIKAIRRSHPRSFEHQFHLTGAAGLVLPMRPGQEPDVATELAEPRLERAIGVIYRPDSELESHYFQAELSRQFDEYIWIDETTALAAVPVPADHQTEDTYPFGV